MMSKPCTCCGAEEVLGIWFPRVKAAILKRVMRAGNAGLIASDMQMKRHNFKAHVYQINSILEETDHRVRGNILGEYRLISVDSPQQSRTLNK